VDLTAEQKTRLASVLERMTGKSVRLNTAIDPSIVGGVSVQIGEDIIDGTFTTRLAEARRALLA
jgi:F-type H+-transporting ATPase subunit delta